MIEFIKKIPGLRSGIGRRFILYILLFSSVITFMGTGLQLYLDYDRDLKLIHTSLKQVESSYLHSITNSLWVTDDELLHIQLEGIMRLPDMQFIEVRKGTEVLQAIGTPQSESIIEQTIPLIYDYNGRDVHLGELHVVASLKGVYARILDRVLVILGIQTIKTFLVSLFIFIIFYLLVGRYIFYMASFVESIRFESMDQPLHLDRKPKKKKPDELDQLATAFNRMRENLARDVIRREIAEKELRESEERYRSLVENQTELVSRFTPDGTFVFVNDAYCHFFEKTKDELVGKKWQPLPINEDLAFVQEKLQTLSPSNPTVLIENRLFSSKGDIHWMQFVNSGSFDLHGDLVEIQSVGRDITERKRAEEALRESEAQKKAILDASIDVIRLVDKDMKIIWANKTTTTELKAATEQLVGKFCYEAVAGRDTPCPGCATKKAIESGKIERTLMHQKELKGIKEETYWDDYAVPVKNESDDIVNIIQISRNITNRKLAEEALRESQKKYRTVLDSNPDPVVVYDMEGKVAYLNRAFERVFGWSLEEQIGKKIDNFVPEENWPETRMMINKVTVLGESFSGLETRRYTKEGKILDIGISGSCYRDQEGDITASVINLRDITKQNKLEVQLQQATKMEAIATLAGGVAHEFNNALMGIMGNIELLKMDLPEDERQDRYFEAMKGSGYRMSRLTDQLLAYAQGGKYQPKNIKLDDFVIETLPILQHDLDPSVRVETHFPKDISYIKADNAQMQMVLSAILANSNEATEEEGLIRITAGNKDVGEDLAKQYPGLKPGRYVCLTIEDGGKGMDKETRTGIFEPFFTTKFQGRGMGMAAVYGIVKNHGGWIYVDSELGKGTVVQIYLPAVEAVAAKPKKATAEVARGSGTILMIEDEDVVIEVTQAMLEMLGYRVLVAKTGKDAIHITETFDGQIDLALLDIKLPDMEGGKVYPLIMGSRPSLKVIVFSGYAIDGPARKILDAGAQDFIQKPFSLATLSEKLREVWEGE